MNKWYTTLSLHLLQCNANIYTTHVGIACGAGKNAGCKIMTGTGTKLITNLTFLVLPLKPLDTNSTHKTPMNSFNIEIPTQSDNIFGGLS